MARTFDHHRLTADEFAAGLDQAGLTAEEFQRLTGASRNAVRSWLFAEDHPRAQEPPFWVTSWLGLYLLPGARERAQAIAESMLLADQSSGD
jgi:hypothetical protein